MLIVLTVFGVWLGVQVNGANTQRRAVKWLEQNGGWVGYDWQYDDRGHDRPPGPYWLRALVGDDYFQRVVAVGFDGEAVADVSRLAKLHHLERVFLHGSPTGDFSPLANLTELKELDLSSTAVCDLAVVSRFKELEFLDLARTQVSDISPLRELAQLKSLRLADTKVRDLSPLANLHNLRMLNIDDTPVVDFTPLRSLEGLEDLFIAGTSGSDENVRDLQKALPNCKIVRNIFRTRR